MAKLTGVKTIDMVGGEITKVEYNGELYAKVDGKIKTGDIARALRSVNSINLGEFAMVDSVDRVGDPEIEPCGGYYASSFTYFRKVSTKAPSLESRVETLEAKVATLEKGEKVGAENETQLKDESTALRVGDYAKITEDSYEYKVGDIVKIISEEGAAFDFRVEFVNVTGECKYDGQTDGYIDRSFATKATDVEVAEARWAAIGRKPNEFKKGDIVHADRDDAEFTVLSVDEILSGVVSFESRRVRLEDVGLVVPVESRFDR